MPRAAICAAGQPALDTRIERPEIFEIPYDAADGFTGIKAPERASLRSSYFWRRGIEYF